MKIANVEVKRRVWAGAGGALAVIAAWAWWSQATLAAAGAGRAAPEAFIQLTGRGDAAVDRILREQAAFQDATPLFFPTEANFRSLNLAAGRPLGQVFQDFPEVLKFQADAPRFGAEVVTPPETPAELMEKGNEAPFAGFGQVEDERGTLQARWARVEAKSLQDGKLALAFDIGSAGSPAAEFGPLEFAAKVNPAGLVGSPVLLRGSGVDEVDNFARDYLVKTARIGAQLPPGNYRITVGP